MCRKLSIRALSLHDLSFGGEMATQQSPLLSHIPLEMGQHHFQGGSRYKRGTT